MVVLGVLLPLELLLVLEVVLPTVEDTNRNRPILLTVIETMPHTSRIPLEEVEEDGIMVVVVAAAR